MESFKRIFNTAITLVTLTTTYNVQAANSVDLALSNKTAKLTYASTNLINDKSVVSASYLHHSQDDEKANLVDMALLVGGVQKLNKLLLGGKIFYGNTDSLHAPGLALGAQAEYKVAPQLFLKGQAFYSPAVTSFSDLENYREVELRVAYEPFSEAEIALGYRNISLKIEDTGSVDIHNGAFLALTLKF
ncbi:YfaZ family outer membrane protein [Algibacillus agarilyticus]|uniref:YfaZ family outer membrane protein n=1 Tax=Algibacillus agarilyticus TaxID=2234133 RepID=UPI000DD0A625|nr:YfaZ family outer membrane protein [Algibacillus agarilyticus]